MAQFINLKVLGDKELARRLTKYANKDQKKAVDMGLKNASKFIRDAAKKEVKRKGATGASAKGIKAKKIKTKGKKGLFGWRVASSTREDIEKKHILGDLVWGKKGFYYPAAQEYGWKMPNGKRVRGTGAMKRTMVRFKTKAIQIVRREIRAALAKRFKPMSASQAASQARGTAKRAAHTAAARASFTQ